MASTSTSSKTSNSKSCISFFRLLFIMVALPVLIPVFLVVLVCLALSSLLLWPCSRGDWAQPTKMDDREPIVKDGEIEKGDGEEKYFRCCHDQGGRGYWIHRHRWPSMKTTNSKNDATESICIVVHGYAEYCTRTGYRELAKQLNEMGIEVLAMDHIGHGKSTGKRAVIPNIQHAVDDVFQMIRTRLSEWKKQQSSRHPAPRLLLFGHCMGGLIGLMVAAQAQQHGIIFDALIMSAPATDTNPDFAPSYLRFAARVLSRLAPLMQLSHLPAEAISRNNKVVESLKSDPMMYSGGMKARLAGEMLAGQKWLLCHLSQITQPLLILHGTEDSVVPLFASQKVLSGVASDDKSLITYAGAYHEVFEDEEYAEKFFADITSFIQKNISLVSDVTSQTKTTSFANEPGIESWSLAVH